MNRGVDRGLNPDAEMLHEKEEAIARLTQELEDTNRGVLALYAELDDRATLLRTANELKDQFLSHLSHEFRTPLNSITALSAMLLKAPPESLGDDERKHATYIQRSALELLGMVNDLLDLAKIEAGQLDVRNQEVSIQEVFGSLRGVLRPLMASDVELVFDDAASLPAIHTDGAKITQILRNLISNALKFTRAGEVRVSAKSDGTRIVFSVTDTGIGIPDSERERIFDAFTQVDNALQREAGGTGLGLSLSRKLATAIGGTLHVESEVGAGSTFSLVLPIQQA